jgi:hypothetical protein
MGKRRSAIPWVSTYDQELNRWVSWDEMKSTWYREIRARRQFMQANHPYLWTMKSNWLHLAARLLWSSGAKDEGYSGFETQSVALMLAGMSLECAIKSRMIALCGYPLIASDRKRILSGNHDLVELAKSACVRTNVGDRTVLKSLTPYIRWLGRYPTPRSEDEMVRHVLEENGAKREIWSKYEAVRMKIGVSVTSAIQKWSRSDGKAVFK